MIGILAYGSLITNPGQEIEEVRVGEPVQVQTPFDVEYARKSKGRAYAPTLVPVGLRQGSRVNAQVFVLRSEIDEQQAADLLHRRERDKVGNLRVLYSPPEIVTENSVLVERLVDFAGLETVLYTRIGSNLPEILDPDVPTDKKARLLAYLAVESVNQETFERGRDGIQYLLDNINNCIFTQLTEPYCQAILSLADKALDLSEARLHIARKKGIIGSDGG